MITIRTQDRENKVDSKEQSIITNVANDEEGIYYLSTFDSTNRYITLGSYRDRARCLEILDEIQEHEDMIKQFELKASILNIRCPDYTNSESVKEKLDYFTNINKVFNMPSK